MANSHRLFYVLFEKIYDFFSITKEKCKNFREIP